MANEAHKIKLLVLWDILCKNTDENHALNTDEISELLALRGLNVSRKILVQDIATLCDNGYDVLSYYLLCFSKGHDDIVTYRLDKMESVKVEELERESHPEYELFNTEEYRKQVFSMFGGESQNITLLFTANILSDMFDRFGDDIRIKKADEETYSVDVTVQISKTFFAWIVGTQGKVKIKSPRKVIDEFNAFVAKIKEEY